MCSYLYYDFVDGEDCLLVRGSCSTDIHKLGPDEAAPKRTFKNTDYLSFIASCRTYIEFHASRLF